ncbi:MAG: response regulator [Solirubrobacterales bacterium]
MICNMPILLVEDDPVDALAIKRAVQDLHLKASLTHVVCARDAIAHLRSAQNDKPGLILLDLHMPDTDGLEFLQVLKNDPALTDIPVVALTGSDAPRDVLKSFDLGIAGYMVKSTQYKDLLETIRTIQDYWSLSQSPVHRVESVG